MKKKILGGVAVIAIVFFSAFNINFNINNKDTTSILLKNIEALGSCESAIITSNGKSTTLNCTNSSGESYSIQACDHDSGYLWSCTGRTANT